MLVRVVWIDQTAAQPRLEGARIDMPVEGLVSEDRALEIWGWALGRRIQPQHVAFMTDRGVPFQVRVDQPRPDIAARYPSVKAASTSGFRGVADLNGRGVRGRLLVAAMWPDGVQTPLGAVHVERFWPRDPDPEIAALVSIVVVGSEEELIERSLESALAQSYAPCELVVVGPANRASERAAARFDSRFVPLEGSGVADACATAVRRTNGDLLVFLQAGRLLRHDGLFRAVAQLTIAPWAAAVLDLGLDPDPDRRPALYRRSAIRIVSLGQGEEGDPELRLLDALRTHYLVEGLDTP
jgi:hypothetical protein